MVFSEQNVGTCMQLVGGATLVKPVLQVWFGLGRLCCVQSSTCWEKIKLLEAGALPHTQAGGAWLRTRHGAARTAERGRGQSWSRGRWAGPTGSCPRLAEVWASVTVIRSARVCTECRAGVSCRTDCWVQSFGIILTVHPETCATARGKDISVNYSDVWLQQFSEYFTEAVFILYLGSCFLGCF